MLPISLVGWIVCLLLGIFTGEDLPPTPSEIVTTTTTTLRQIPEPSMETSSVDHGMGEDVSGWIPLVAGHFEPEDRERILCLMEKESGGNPTAKNETSGARGLLQVMPFWASEYGLGLDELFVPEINLWVARKILDSQGWTAWAPYNRGECR